MEECNQNFVNYVNILITVVNSDLKLTPIQTMMCGANESSNHNQSEHKQ